jgi:hypothetical protein
MSLDEQLGARLRHALEPVVAPEALWHRIDTTPTGASSRHRVFAVAAGVATLVLFMGAFVLLLRPFTRSPVDHPSPHPSIASEPVVLTNVVYDADREDVEFRAINLTKQPRAIGVTCAILDARGVVLARLRVGRLVVPGSNTRLGLLHPTGKRPPDAGARCHITDDEVVPPPPSGLPAPKQPRSFRDGWRSGTRMRASPPESSSPRRAPTRCVHRPWNERAMEGKLGDR